MQLGDYAERLPVAVVHLRHGGAQLGQDEALPGEHQGARDPGGTQAEVWVQEEELEAPVSVPYTPTPHTHLHTLLHTLHSATRRASRSERPGGAQAEVWVQEEELEAPVGCTQHTPTPYTVLPLWCHQESIKERNNWAQAEIWVQKKLEGGRSRIPQHAAQVWFPCIRLV